MDKRRSFLFRITIALLVASIALTASVFATPSSALSGGGIQPNGWMCYGYVCWLDNWSCGYVGNTHWYCTNYCQQYPWLYWRCLGQSGCQNGC